MDRRLKIIPIFYKSGHSYKKNFGLKAKPLGTEIMGWWEEIKGTGGTINVRFGGPTGIYTLVVLMSWWCSLLKGQPDNELANCLHTLDDIDRTILSVVCDVGRQPPTALSPGGPS